jgi:hypothetical protein
MHTIKWEHTEYLNLYAPYCCCTFTCFLQIVLNWASLGTDKHKNCILCIYSLLFYIH